MKKYLFLLCCLCTTSIIAQNIDSRYKSSTIYNFSSDKDSIASLRTLYSIEKDTINVSISQKWNTSKLIWENSERYEKVLDKNRMQTLNARYQWYEEKNAWYEFAKTENKFDANKNLLLTTIYQASGEVGRWTLKEKTEYAYDTNGNKIVESQYEWHYGWKGTYKESATYNVANKIASFESHYWNEDRKMWKKSKKSKHTYDAHNNEIFRMEWRGFSGNDNWIDDTKFEFVYDKNNNKVSEVKYGFDFARKLWIKTRKEDFSFDENNKEISHTINGYDGIVVVLSPLSKFERAYNTQGKISLLIAYEWDSKLKKWSKLEQYEKTYNDAGKMILEIHSHKNNKPVLHIIDKTEIMYEGEKETVFLSYWDEKKHEMRNSSKLERTFKNGHLISEINYRWNHDIQAIIGEEKRELIYDTSNSVIFTKNYSWDKSINNWKIVSKTYNDSH
ncbi:hypothetical protein [Emticicia fontis]